MPGTVRISAATARSLALRSQGLDTNWGLPSGKEGVARAIERLGYVQVDTIAVVQRAHHHTLWTRCPDYAPDMLHDLQARDRSVFEYWTHAASYVPTRDYRYYMRRMHAYAEGPRKRDRLDEIPAVVEDVLARIRAEGPLGSADFKAPDGFQRGTWWSWKPAKRALEALFSSGVLMVSERRNFQRLYDLRERVLPPETNTTLPDSDEQARFGVRQGLAAHGVSTLFDIRRGRAGRNERREAIRELVSSGEVMPVEIDGVEGEYYALAGAITGAMTREAGPPQLHILSPFDNAVIWRERVNRLFSFDYRLECYTPAGKRRYGYFALPVLWGERFVARLDAKADRKTGTLQVRRLTFEPQLDAEETLLSALADKLWSFATFNGCSDIVLESVDPQSVEQPVSLAVASRSR